MRKLSDLAALALADISDDDLLYIVDDSDSVSHQMSVGEFRKMMSRALIEVVTGTTYNAGAADEGKTLVCTHASGCTITVGHDGTGAEDQALGWGIQAIQAGGKVDFAAASGHSLSQPASAKSPPETAESGSMVGCICTDASAGANVFRFFGGLG